MLKFYLSVSALAISLFANASSLLDLRENIVCASPLDYTMEIENRFFESFESWNGTDVDWLPEEWSEIVSDEKFPEINDGVFTWHVGTQSGTTPFAIDGVNYAVVYYAYEKDADGNTIDLPQDEWLIMPSFEVQDGDRLKFSLGYSPMFLFDMNNENVDWGAMDFVVRKPSTTLKVCVREGTEGEWTEIFDVYDEWEETPFDDLFNKYMGSEFRRYELDLSDFSGKNVDVAFRFVGKYGNTMEIDAVGIDNHGTAVDIVEMKAKEFDVYNLAGVCVLRRATLADVEKLDKGIYVVNGRKIAVK